MSRRILGLRPRVPGSFGSPARAGLEERRGRTREVGLFGDVLLAHDLDPPGEFGRELRAVPTQFVHAHVSAVGTLFLPPGQQIAEAGFVGHGETSPRATRTSTRSAAPPPPHPQTCSPRPPR